MVGTYAETFCALNAPAPLLRMRADMFAALRSGVAVVITSGVGVRREWTRDARHHEGLYVAVVVVVVVVYEGVGVRSKSALAKSSCGRFSLRPRSQRC